MSERIFILTDYRDFFATKLEGTARQNTRTTIDTSKLAALLSDRGFEVSVVSFSEIDYSLDYRGAYILYASIEDEGQFYKNYIEDHLLALWERGAVLIPDFKWFRAHSNKVFQELLRSGFSDCALRVPGAVEIGHAKELERVKDKITYPAVVKVSGGSGSRGVDIAKDYGELQEKVRSMMDHHYRDFADTLYLETGLAVKRFARRITGRRVGEETIIKHMPTNKIVIQQYIPDLAGDYKVLYFAGRYFVLNRKNRDNDFRASGSGKFSYPEETEELYRVLDLARRAAKEIGMPMQSLDIGCNGDGCYLLGFQCVYFGPYTLQFAPCCYEWNADAPQPSWTRLDKSFDLEEEYVRAVCAWLE